MPAHAVDASERLIAAQGRSRQVVQRVGGYDGYGEVNAPARAAAQLAAVGYRAGEEEDAP